MAWDPFIPFALAVIALLGSGIIIMRTPDRTGAWTAWVLAIALAAVVALVLVLTVLDLLIPGPPFVLLS